jgi:hypothetical protein
MHARLAALCAGVLFAAGGAGAAGTTWDRNADWLQQQIRACAERTEEFACRYFPARALNRLFGFGEFCNNERCLLPYEIAAGLDKGGHWAALGKANDQAALTQAQEMASGGLPVIAVQASGDKGLIAIVMPGKRVASEHWRLTVPLGVGTRFDKPEASVYAQGLNFLFSDPAKVKLYAYK